MSGWERVFPLNTFLTESEFLSLITTNEIVQNVTQASAGIAEVNENIATSSQMTAELSALAENLSALVARFRI